MASSRRHVIVGDDYLSRAYSTAVWSVRCYWHCWEVRHVKLFAIAPRVTRCSDVVNRIVQGDEEAIARHRSVGELSEPAKNDVKLSSGSRSEERRVGKECRS